MKIALENPEYEPPVRDPKAIRNTVIILVAIMLLGGFLIVWKYKEKMTTDYEEVVKGRSAMSLGNVRTNFQTLGLDGEVYTFNILEEKITLISVISVNLAEESQIIIDEMKLAAEYFADKQQLQMVCISADPESKVSVARLNEFAKKAGIPVGDENWHVLTAEADSFSGFIKDGLKLGMVSKDGEDSVEHENNVYLSLAGYILSQEVDLLSNKRLPDLLRIIDPNTNIRGEIDEFKFNYYHEIEERTRQEVEDDPGLLTKEDKSLQNALKRHQNAVQHNRDKMYKYIDYIIDFEEQDEDFSKKNNSNRYNVPMIVFGGFVLFILFMGYRLKRSRNRA